MPGLALSEPAIAVMASSTSIPGWYGKLPTIGDFASRRLAADFIEPWDTWLAEGLAAQREDLGDAWLAAYLASPTWRFVLMSDVLEGLSPPRALAGVLMPSVDRVGRYFPLTLVADLADVPGSAAAVESLLAWLHRLEDVALDALQDDWSIDDLEDALGTVGPPPSAETESSLALIELGDSLSSSDGGFIPIEALRSRSELAALFVTAVRSLVSSSWVRAVAGRSFWLSDHAENPQLLVTAGLPGKAAFARMFGAKPRISAGEQAGEDHPEGRVERTAVDSDEGPAP